MNPKGQKALVTKELFDAGQEALKLWREWFNRQGSSPSIDGDISWYCFFCNETLTGNEEDSQHAPDCIYIRAKKLIEAAK